MPLTSLKGNLVGVIKKVIDKSHVLAIPLDHGVAVWLK